MNRPPIEDILPLAPLQAGLLFHARYDDAAPDVYTVQFTCELDGDLDPQRLRAAADALVRRHAALRVAFRERASGDTVQVVAARITVPWRELDLTTAGPDAPSAWQEFLTADRARRFNPARPPLLRFTLARLPADPTGRPRHALALTHHHLLLDGWSMPVLLRDLFALYGEAAPTGLVPVQAWGEGGEANRAQTPHKQPPPALGGRPQYPLSSQETPTRQPTSDDLWTTPSAAATTSPSPADAPPADTPSAGTSSPSSSDTPSAKTTPADTPTAIPPAPPPPRPADLPPVTPYRDYLAWLSRQDRTAAEAAWRTVLDGVTEPTLLAPALAAPAPTDAAAPSAAPPPDGPVRHEAQLPADLAEALHGLARTVGVTVSSLVQAAWGVVVGRLSGRRDVLVGTAVSGRPDEVAGAESMVGLFINTVPVRVRWSPSDSLRTLLTALHRNHGRVLPYPYLTLTDLRRVHGIDGELFDTLAVYENYPVDAAALREPVPGLRLRSVGGHDATHYPVTLAVSPTDGLRVRVDADPHRLPPGAAADLAARLIRVLTAFARGGPDQRIDAVDLLSTEERHHLLHGSPTTAPPAATCGDLFTTRATGTPDAVAVEDAHGTALTYAALAERAEALAETLRAAGVAAEDRVLILAHRSPALPVAMLGAMMAGAVAVPVDPTHPAARLAWIADDCHPTAVIATPHEAETWAATPPPPQPPHLLTITPDGHVTAPPTAAAPSRSSHPPTTDIAGGAYLIYTSGSTGRPKGVLVTHAGLAALTAGQIQRFALAPTSRVAQLSSPGFDAFVLELCASVLAGATLVLPPPGPLAGEDLAAFLTTRAVTHALITPSVLGSLPAGTETATWCSGCLVVGAEACSTGLVDRFAPGRRMVNAYGPTEATVVATTSTPLHPGGGTPPIGAPLPGTTVRVLDTALQPVPVGVAGELYLAGPALARGYHGRPGLTAERFVPDPYGPPGTRMYRTGDVVRRRPDGDLVFVGRADHQVKVNGLRVELGEIEAALASCPGVAQAAARVWTPPSHPTPAARPSPRGPRLVGYLVPAAHRSIDPAAVREHLATTLPTGLVPTELVTLDALPVNASGKLDRAALPAPTSGRTDSPHRAAPGTEAATQAEERLRALFAELLGVDQVGPDDDFFVLGGDSIISLRLVSRARRDGLHLTPREVFVHRTPAALAAVAARHTDTGRPDTATEPREGPLLPTPAMRWWQDSGGPLAGFHQSMLLHTPPGCDEAHLTAALDALLNHHDALRMVLGKESDGQSAPCPPINDPLATATTKPGKETDAPSPTPPGTTPNEPTSTAGMPGRADAASVLHGHNDIPGSAATTTLSHKQVDEQSSRSRPAATSDAPSHRPWRLTIRPPASVRAADILRRVDLRDTDPADLPARINAEARRTWAQLRPETGAIVRAVWFDRGDQPGRLLLAIHHFAVDAVSWQILLGDLATAYDALAAGRRPDLDPVPTPVRHWSALLHRWATEPHTEAELPFWQEQLRDAPPLLPGRTLDPALDHRATARTLTTDLPTAPTAALLGPVPTAFHATVPDLLLTALAVAVADWRPRHAPTPPTAAADSTLLVDVEDHGRRTRGTDDPDLSRTVGWFTALHPVRLTPSLRTPAAALASGRPAATALKRVKEQLRAAPDHGLGHGLLRHLNPRTSPLLAALPHPDIALNYLGRAPATPAPSATTPTPWSPAPAHELTGAAALRHPVAEPTPAWHPGDGPDEAAQAPLAHLVQLDVSVTDGPDGPRLQARWSWAGRLLTDDEATDLAATWQRALTALATTPTTLGGRTPSDVPLVDLTQPQLDALERAHPDARDILPLTPLQEGLLFHADYDPDGADPYTVQLVLDLAAADGPALRAAAGDLMHRHPHLGAAFVHAGPDRPVQVVSAPADAPWHDLDLSDLAPDAAEKAWRSWQEADRARSFDPARPPLLRWALVRLPAGPDGDRHRLVLTHHHLLLDGWSMPLLVRDLLLLAAARAGTPSADAAPDLRLPPPAPYRDYLAWLARQDRAAAEAAWSRLLGLPDTPVEPCLLAPALPRPTTADERPTPVGAVQPLRLAEELPAELSEAVVRLARTVGVTVSSVVQAAWGVVVGRLTGRADVLFGTAVSGRPAELPGAESMVGLFINTVPVRVRWSPTDSLRTLLTALHRQQSEAAAHPVLGLTDLMRLHGGGDLFDTLAVYENYPVDAAAPAATPAAGPRLVRVEGHDATHYPLSLIAVPGDRLRLHLEYRPDRVAPDIAAAVLARVVRVLTACTTADPDRPVARLDALLPAERDALRRWSTPTRHPTPATLDALFTAQATRAPHAPAVETPDAHTLDYATLTARVTETAATLSDLGVTTESPVLVLGSRSVGLVVGVLAVSRAGGAFVPVDAAHPADRIAFVAADSRARVAVTTPEHADAVPPTIDATLILDTEGKLMRIVRQDKGTDDTSYLTRRQFSSSPTPTTEADTAYVIYTSGSTGHPKGVAVTHAGLAHLTAGQIDRFAITPAARMAQLSSPGFDAFVLELCASLLAGATLVLPEPGILAGEDLAQVLRDRRITHALITPSVLATLPPEAAGGDWCRGCLVVGAETCPAPVVERFAAGRRMVNAYGPTEATVVATTSSPLHPDDGTPPIGHPLPGMVLRVLDAALQPVPVGARGELYLAGPGLARGYHHRPDLTAERFIADPYGPPGTRMYRTGDIVSHRPTGELDHHGRADHQVKIRGHRIELAEIETALASAPDVTAAAAVLRPGPAHRPPALVGFVVTAATDPPAAAARARTHVARTLPPAFVPAVVQALPALPTTRNGKLDRAALQTLATTATSTTTAATASDTATPGSTVRPGRSHREAVLTALFAEVLGLPQVDPHAGFFDLGGDSLTAARLVAAVRAALDRPLSIRALFEHPTPAALADHLAVATPLADDFAPLLPLSRRAAAPPLFCFSAVTGLSWSYAGLVPHLGPIAPILGVQARGLIPDSAPPTSAADLIADHVATLRDVAPDGPYHLLGWSYGGLIAHAVARALHAQGAEVALLALLDTHPSLMPEAAPPSTTALTADHPAIVRLTGELLGAPHPAPTTYPALHRTLAAANGPGTALDEPTLHRIGAVTATHLRLLPDLLPHPSDPPLHDVDALLFTATHHAPAPADLWRPHLPHLTVHPIACTHAELATPGPLDQVARTLAARLGGADT